MAVDPRSVARKVVRELKGLRAPARALPKQAGCGYHSCGYHGCGYHSCGVVRPIPKR